MVYPVFVLHLAIGCSLNKCVEQRGALPHQALDLGQFLLGVRLKAQREQRLGHRDARQRPALGELDAHAVQRGCGIADEGRLQLSQDGCARSARAGTRMSGVIG